jgi:NAD(P)-dependent dehydrogenase (short-subunit alcohol dehydrogenase family)
MDLQNKVIVVTGAFGTLGRAVAEAAKEAGATVALIDHAPAPADEFTQSCIVVHGVDLTREEDGRLAIEAVNGEAGRIDALINCAGGFTWQTLSDGDIAAWERMFALNLKTALVASKAALPHLIASGAGAIVNVAAASARQAGAGMGAYAASKAGVMKLTESLAEEWKGKVRVNAVLPSIIDTALNRKDMPKADFATWVTPAELAAVILFLASDQASAITGALLPVTGRV